MTASFDELMERMHAGATVPPEEIVGVVWPLTEAAVRACRSLGHLRASEDDVRDVTTAVVEKISRDGGRGLRLFRDWQARNAGLGFSDWLRIVTGNAARDHVRRALGGRKPEGELPSVKRLLNELGGSGVVEELGVRPPVTDQQTAQQVLAFARTKLPDLQYRALLSWLQGQDPEAIAADLELADPDEAHKLLRAAVASLRRHFA